MKHYLVDWHLGGYSWSDTFVESYCDQCGDSDRTLLSFDDNDNDIFDLMVDMRCQGIDVESCVKLIKEINKGDQLIKELNQIKEFLNN